MDGRDPFLTMAKLGVDLEDGSSPIDSRQANPEEARKLSIQRCLQSLEHACQCRDPNCRLTRCQKMKHVVRHTKVCKRKTNGECPICKQLIALCIGHGKHCSETKCPVPYCSNIKHKLKQHQLQKRSQQAQLLRRRMAVMNTRTVTSANTLPGNNVSMVQQAVQNVVPPGAPIQNPYPFINCDLMDGRDPFLTMAKLGVDLEDGSSPIDSKQENPEEARKLSIQRCLQSLEHACQCRDPNCRLTRCQKIKHVVRHTKVCKRKTNGECPICKQLIALCIGHGKHCSETKCPVPYCSNIKHKLKQHQLQKRLQQAQLLRRRMAVMNTRTVTSANTLPGNNVSMVQNVVPPGAVSPSMNPRGLGSGGVAPHQPGLGLKPGTQTPPENVMQVVKQVIEETASAPFRLWKS